jgi:hypothetical protein
VSLDHLSPEDRAEVKDWDWRAIRRAEAEALAKASERPTCRRCHHPMWVGQSDTHITCREGHDPTGRRGAPAETKDPCRTCRFTSHVPCPICRAPLSHHPDGRTTPAEWAGLARMSAAKRAAGGQLTSLEAQALRHCPLPEFLGAAGYQPHPDHRGLNASTGAPA